MTLFEITAVGSDERAPACCTTAIHHAGIGRSHGHITAREIRDDLRRHDGAYYATIGGIFRDVVAVDCPECGEPQLTTAARFVSGDELRSLPALRRSIA